MWTITKKYPHSLGLSCVFRQPRATSHCRYLHGYALAVTVVLEAYTLDDNNWVQDFGSMKPLKKYLSFMLDHTTLIAEDDPHRQEFERLSHLGLCDLRIVRAVGCEAFATMIGTWIFNNVLVFENSRGRNVQLRSVTVAEHEGNAATWEPNPALGPVETHKAR